MDNGNYYERLDRFLRNVLNDLKLSSIYKLLRKGNVKVNGKRVKDESHRLSLGDVLQVYYLGDSSKMKRLEETRELVPQKIPLDILYEDDTTIAIDKPAGISVHPGKGIQIITLIEGLLAYGREKGFEPHPVHRLDKHTSGVILFAKSPASAREISRLFREHEVEKIYLTLVKGCPQIESARLESLNEGILEVLEYSLEKRYREVSLLKVRLHTGKKHQIRRQMAQINCPVAGDDVYGDRTFNRNFKKASGLKRYFLHCQHLGFTCSSGLKIAVDSELPEDLLKVLASIE
ncbi:MAG TPA: RluA family pseudouridine synthase [Mesotoga sp.]|nr:RluA family pseudouridine synthase [Mesotoga sp.]MDD5743396.1 RluA family pseudouridine synthase [Mesotoga sp.]HOI63664.1 RluA family pseudouridine synthase [Mesotoga sp.]HPB63251.1 RluA family pseudouridine synthase [Mesotoga sp.]HPX21669.1 RluA family pseudouridine synthase [Mesotoga sp.]